MKTKRNNRWIVMTATLAVLALAGVLQAAPIGESGQQLGQHNDALPPGGMPPPPVLSGTHTPEVVVRPDGAVEMVVPAVWNGNYTSELFYSVYRGGRWSAPVQITSFGRDVINVRFAVTQNGERYLAVQVAERVDRIYVMQKVADAPWSAPMLVSEASTPSFEPSFLFLDGAVGVIFRTGNTPQTSGVKAINIQENIPIW